MTVRTLYVCALVLAGVCPAAAQETRFAGDPLLVGIGARALGMGSAYAAIVDDATATYWNPAVLAGVGRREVQAQHAEQFGGAVNHEVLTFALPSRTGAWGLGVGFVRLSVDGIKFTRLEDPALPLDPGNRPEVLSEVGTSQNALYLSYGRRVQPRWYVGASLKMVWVNLSAGEGSGYGIEVASLYQVTPEWRVAAVLRDAVKTRIRFNTDTQDDIPPSLLLGVAWSKPVASVRGTLTGGATVHVGQEGAAAEDIEALRVGFEYRHRSSAAFRLGFDNDHFTAGAGIAVHDRFAFDLAFLEDGRLDNTYRLSASFYF